MDAIIPFEPAWGAVEDWNQAFDRVEDYLRACQIPSRLHRARLTCGILRRVDARGPQAGYLPGLAIEETRRAMRAWFARIVDDNATAAGNRTDTDELMALYVSEAARRWPASFMGDGTPPAELRETVKRAMLRAGPQLQVSSMVPRALDFGLLPRIANRTMLTLEKRPLLKLLVVWLVFIGILTWLFWYTRNL